MTRPLRLLTAILATALWAALAQAALAASSERYASDLLSARFITAEQGVAPDSTALSAALEIELSEGWKTYWKSPGEVGYPPGIDWSGAQNVAGVEMQRLISNAYIVFRIQKGMIPSRTSRSFCRLLDGGV